MQLEPRKPLARSTQHRAVTVAIGILFVALAIVIVATSGPSTRIGAVIAAILVGGLGIDAVVSAVRGRRSWLSRIGPLP